MKDALIIFDTTMRDGEQSPGASMTKDEKLRIARALERMKVDVIEAGFPASSNGDFEAVKAIAGMVVGLGRLDALVFTAGIGENSALIRSRVLARLGFLGLAEDAEANARHGRDTRGRISPDGPVVAVVVPTDEELMIARDTARLTAPGARLGKR